MDEARPPEGAEESLPIASQRQRYRNNLIDQHLCTLIIVLLLVLLLAVFPQLIDQATGIVVGLLIYLLYFVFFETFFQKTPAKFFTKTRVVTTTGGIPTGGIILLRTLCRFIPFDVFSFLSLYPRGWHDKFSGTVVIDETGKIRKNEGFFKATLMLTVDYIVITAVFFLVLLFLIFAYIRPVLGKSLLKDLSPVTGYGLSERAPLQ